MTSQLESLKYTHGVIRIKELFNRQNMFESGTQCDRKFQEMITPIIQGNTKLRCHSTPKMAKIKSVI